MLALPAWGWRSENYHVITIDVALSASPSPEFAGSKNCFLPKTPTGHHSHRPDTEYAQAFTYRAQEQAANATNLVTMCFAF